MKHALLTLGAIALISALPAAAEAGGRHGGGHGHGHHGHGHGHGGSKSSFSLSLGFGYASSGYGYGGYGGYGYGGYGGYCGPTYYAPAYVPAPVYCPPPVVYAPVRSYYQPCAPSYGGYYSGGVTYRYRD